MELFFSWLFPFLENHHQEEALAGYSYLGRVFIAVLMISVATHATKHPGHLQIHENQEPRAGFCQAKRCLVTSFPPAE